MTVEFYGAMQHFINGTSTHDPRESLQKKRAHPGADAQRRLRGRGRGRRGRSKGRGQRTASHCELITIVTSDEETNQPEMVSLPTATDHYHLPASVLPLLQICNDVDAGVAAGDGDTIAGSDDIDTEATIAANGDGDAAMASAHNPDPESTRQYAEQIATAVSELEHIARSHHRNSTTADTLVKVLPFLCEAILDGMDLTPVERVEKAMQTIQEKGHKFWGSGDVFSRRRTARDCLLLVYHDAAYRSLTSAVS